MTDLDYYKEHLKELAIRGLSPDEQETVVVIPHAGTTRVSTSDPNVFNKFRRMLEDPVCEWKLVDISRASNCTDPNAITEAHFETNSNLVSFRNAKITRELTDEQRAAAANRLNNVRRK